MILLEAQKYGPFAPVVGYGSAIMASAGALFVMWGGRMKKWRPPDTDMSGTARSFVLLLCGVFMVVEYYFAEPSWTGMMIGAAAALAVISFIFYLMYSSIITNYGYKKPVPKKGGTGYDETLILGGREFRPEAEEERKKLGVDPQTLLEGKTFKVDLLWDRANLSWVRTRALLYFTVMLALGTSALTMAGFATQVILTKRAAAAVVKTSDSPGLEDKPASNQ